MEERPMTWDELDAFLRRHGRDVTARVLRLAKDATGEYIAKVGERIDLHDLRYPIGNAIVSDVAQSRSSSTSA
jgi:hypothetical protein